MEYTGNDARLQSTKKKQCRNWEKNTLRIYDKYSYEKNGKTYVVYRSGAFKAKAKGYPVTLVEKATCKPSLVIN